MVNSVKKMQLNGNQFEDATLLNAIESIGQIKNRNPIANTATGTGTDRDPTSHTAINGVHLLSYQECDILTRTSNIIYNLVTKLPEQALLNFTGWDIAGDRAPDINLMADFDEWLGELCFWDRFTEAAILGRMYGDGFLIIGADDGNYPDEPLDPLKDIAAIRFVVPRGASQLTPVGQFVVNPQQFKLVR